METPKQSFTKKVHSYAARFRDIRAIGLLLFVVIVLLVSWSGVKVIDTNYQLQKDISRLEQQNQVRKLANTNLKLQNEYFQTDQYLEIAARQDFGLAAPGETVLNVPPQVALAHTTDLHDAEQEQMQAATSKQPASQRNFQAWIAFLLHRQASYGED